MLVAAIQYSMERTSLRNFHKLVDNIDNNNPMSFVMYDQSPSVHHRRTPSYPQRTPETNLNEDLDQSCDNDHTIMHQLEQPMEDPENEPMIYVHPPLRSSMNNVLYCSNNSNSDEDCLEDELIYGLIDNHRNDQKLPISDNDQNIVNDQMYQDNYRQVGIYGWRKKTIYLLLAVIMVLVGINAALTYWIVIFLDLSTVSLLPIIQLLCFRFYYNEYDYDDYLVIFRMVSPDLIFHSKIK